MKNKIQMLILLSVSIDDENDKDKSTIIIAFWTLLSLTTSKESIIKMLSIS